MKLPVPFLCLVGFACLSPTLGEHRGLAALRTSEAGGESRTWRRKHYNKTPRQHGRDDSANVVENRVFAAEMEEFYRLLDDLSMSMPFGTSEPSPMPTVEPTPTPTVAPTSMSVPPVSVSTPSPTAEFVSLETFLQEFVGENLQVMDIDQTKFFEELFANFTSQFQPDEEETVTTVVEVLLQDLSTDSSIPPLNTLEVTYSIRWSSAITDVTNFPLLFMDFINMPVTKLVIGTRLSEEANVLIQEVLDAVALNEQRVPSAVLSNDITSDVGPPDSHINSTGETPSELRMPSADPSSEAFAGQINSKRFTNKDYNRNPSDISSISDSEDHSS